MLLVKPPRKKKPWNLFFLFFEDRFEPGGKTRNIANQLDYFEAAQDMAQQTFKAGKFLRPPDVLKGICLLSFH